VYVEIKENETVTNVMVHQLDNYHNMSCCNT